MIYLQKPYHRICFHHTTVIPHNITSSLFHASIRLLVGCFHYIKNNCAYIMCYEHDCICSDLQLPQTHIHKKNFSEPTNNTIRHTDHVRQYLHDDENSRFSTTILSACCLIQHAVWFGMSNLAWSNRYCELRVRNRSHNHTPQFIHIIILQQTPIIRKL